MKKITLLFALFTFLQGNAQWTTDTSANTLVVNSVVDNAQAIGTSDGKTFIVFWKTVSAPVYFELRAQLLDANGNQQFGSEGMLISNTIPMSTFTVMSKITIDSKNNLYIGVTGTGSGAGNPGFAYKLDVNGTLIWGTNGINLGSGYLPTILPLDNDDVLISYWPGGSLPSKIQKFSPDGTPIWATPIDILPASGTNPTMPADMYELSNHDFTMIYHVKNTIGITTRLYAQRYNSSGIAQWSTPAQLASKSTAYNTEYSGSQDGDVIYYGYSATTGSRFDSFVQKVNPDGSIPWGINGIDFDTNATNYEMDTKIACTPGSQYVWAISKYTPSSQGINGEYIQKFDKTTGARQFTDNAKQVFPMDTNYRNHAGNLYLINDTPFFLIRNGFDNGASPISLNAVLLDASGNFAWPEQFLPVATFSGSKSRITMTKMVNDQSVVVFVEPKVSGEAKIYAQNFMFPLLSNDDFGTFDNSIQLYPNPTRDIFNIKSTASVKSISVYNSLGQLVHHNNSINSFEWNINAANWSNGLYFINLETDNGSKKNIKLIKN